MKYSNSNQPLVCMQTNSTCYKGTSIMTVKGVLWHSTGANNPNIKRYVQPSDNAINKDEMIAIIGKNTSNNDWNHISRQAGLNCWIGKLADGSVSTVQTMPWNYKPWGCGSGPKGSCNNGWIQFEICEDGLTDKNYFDKVYKEACEITAYLCKMFNLDPNGTVDYNGIEVPVILCHADSCDLKLGSNHGDINHWFPKFGKSMETARADVAALLNPAATQYYRVRKSWEDAASQKGAYTNLENAKKKVDSLGSGYYVFDNDGVVVYPIVVPEKTTSNGLKKGDEVMLVPGATYANGATIPSWVFKKKLYVREIQNNDKVVFSTLAVGDITGTTASTNLKPYENTSSKETVPDFKVGDEIQLIAGATYTSGQTIPAWVFKKKLYIKL